MVYQHFAGALIGATFGNGHHSSYMLLIRQRAIQEKLSHGATYIGQEAKIAQGLEAVGVPIRDDVPSYLYLWHGFYRFYFENALRLASIGVGLTVLGLSIWRRRPALDVYLNDPVVTALSGFLIPYSFILSISAPFLYDRYTSINFFLFVALSFRLLQTYMIELRERSSEASERSWAVQG
jgi:hypothetical protein